MNQCKISTVHEVADRDTISRLRIPVHRAARRPDDAVPLEIVPEKTERYPIGLGEDLRGLSACRPRTTSPE
jgi:hypothetical protein